MRRGIRRFWPISETIHRRQVQEQHKNAWLEHCSFLTPRVGINKSNLYGVARAAIWGGFSNIAAVAVWWSTSPSVASVITRLSRRECPSGRQQKNSSNSRAGSATRKLSINSLLGSGKKRFCAVYRHNRKLLGCCCKIASPANTPVYECRATHAAGVRSGRHRIGRSASLGRIAEK
jgi:hypothetical protein